MEEDPAGQGAPSPGSGIDESWFQWLQQTWIGAFGSVFGARLASGAAAFATLAIIGQELGPAQFGQLAILLALLRVAADLVGPALDTAMIRHAARADAIDDQAGVPFMKAVLRWKLAIVLALIVAGIVFARPLRFVFLHETSEPPVPYEAVTLSIWGAGAVLLFAFAQSCMQARQRFVPYASYELINAVLRLAVVGWLLLFDAITLTRLVAVYAVLPAILFIPMWRHLPRGLLGGTPPSTEVRNQLLHFGKWVLVACICTSLAQRVDLFILGFFKIPDDIIGNYGAAIGLVLLGDLIVLSLFNVLLPRASRLQRSVDVEAFLRAFRLPTLAFAVALAPVVLASDLLTRATFGHDYELTAQFFSILLLGTIFTLGCAPATTAIYGLGRSRIVAYMECGRLVLTIGAALIVAPMYGAYGVAWTVASVKGTIGVATVAAVHWEIGKLRARERAEGMADAP